MSGNSSDLVFRTAIASDFPAIGRMLGLAFGFPADRAAAWIGEWTAHSRVVCDGAPADGAGSGGGPVAHALLIPQGEFWGGRSVPMLGVAGVAVPPELRGRGLAQRLMAGVVREAFDTGFALSGLYASTQALYRKVGFEQAGKRAGFKVPVATLPTVRGPSRVVPLSFDNPAHVEQMKACYRAVAPRFDGMLDRGPYIWKRVGNFRDKVYMPFGCFAAGGELAGYITIHQDRKPNGRHDLLTTDLVFRSAEACRELLAFVGAFGTMADDAHVAGGACWPALPLLAQQTAAEAFSEVFMLRIADVRKAIEARGYNAAVSGRFVLEITDELIPENAGRWMVEVGNCRGACQRVGEPPAGVPVVRGDVRALVPLWSGWQTGEQLAALGMLEGDAAGLELATGVFASRGTPWMSDFF